MRFQPLRNGLALMVLWAVAGFGVRTCPGARRDADQEFSPFAFGTTLPPPNDNQEREHARRGIDLLMNGDPDAAIEVFRQIQKNDPESPLGYLFEADATWWKIYFTSANLIDPDVFDVVYSETSPYDSHFQDLVKVAIRKSEAGIRAHRAVARNYLYEGLAYALRARFAGLRDNDLPTARAGKKMRTLLLTALKLDPSLVDAYLGVGIYNYFVDTLPTLIKMLKFLIALPGGDRELGLRQLQQAAEKGELARGEAKFYLAKDFSRRNEQQYARSLELFQELAHEYPHNLLWTLLAGSLETRLGQTQQGEALYGEVLSKTTGLESEVGQALNREARKALQRLHPNEKLD